MAVTRKKMQLHKKDKPNEQWLPITTGACVELTDYVNDSSTGRVSSGDTLNIALAKLDNTKANSSSVYTKEETNSAINSALGSVYTAAGSANPTNSSATNYLVQLSVESSLVTTLTGKTINGTQIKEGFVYNVTDAFTIGGGSGQRKDFVEYESGTTKQISKGTNVVVVGVDAGSYGRAYYWDVLAMSVAGGGSGTVNQSTTAGSLAYYASAGTSVSGCGNNIVYNETASGNNLTLTGTNLKVIASNNIGGGIETRSISTQGGGIVVSGGSISTNNNVTADGVGLFGNVKIGSGTNKNCIENSTSGAPAPLLINTSNGGNINIGNQSSRVGIGLASNASPSYKLHVAGDVYATGGVTALASSGSDAKLKENIKPFNALSILDKLNPVSFTWNDKAKELSSEFKQGVNYGLIAQDSDGVIDNFVFDLQDGYKGIHYEKLIPVLLEAIKEQQIEINKLKDIVNNKK